MRTAMFAVFGLVVGSFVTVLVHRVPRKESLVSPRSRCPRCGTPLRVRDNVPVISWILLRGRCRACGEPISPVYPLLELATAGLFAGASVVYERDFAAGLVAVLLGLLLALGAIDARHRIVPNAITYPALAVLGLALLAGDLAGGGVDVLSGLIGLAVYAGPLFLLALLVPGGMGMGDVKLAALIGLGLGSLGLRYVAVAAGLGILGGGVGAIAAMAFLRYGRRQTIPFGPYLAAGGVGSALFGGPLARAYLSLLG